MTGATDHRALKLWGLAVPRAHLGAEVIRVEPPGGSPGRRDEIGFALRNANKAEVILDLDDPAGRSALELATIAGASAPIATMKSWLGKGVVVQQAYGMTELGGLSTINPKDQAIEWPESIGDGTVFTRLRVVRPDGTDCDPGEPDEIIVSGPGIAPVYWRNEHAYAAANGDGWFHSGDVGIRDAHGIRVVDRLKDLIITGGFNVAPSEIEAVIAEIPGVLEPCVVSAFDPGFRRSARGDHLRRKRCHRRGDLTGTVAPIWPGTRCRATSSFSTRH